MPEPLTDVEFKRMKYLITSGERIAIEMNEWIKAKHVSLSEACTAAIYLNAHFKDNHPELHAEITSIHDSLDKILEEQKTGRPV